MTVTTESRGLHQVALSTLTVGANVRTDLRLTDGLVKSIKANGIIQPPVVFPDPDVPNALRVLAGHRRIAAAQKLGFETIDVLIRDAPADHELVVDQLVENVHRDQLTDGEQAAAYRQLTLDFGLSAMQVATQTGTKLARVGDAVKVASSPVAAKAIDTHQLSIDEALIFDEFAGDDAAIALLDETVTERPEQLQHTAQRIRDERSEAAARQAVVEEIDRLGITQLERGPERSDQTVIAAARLRTEPGHYAGSRVELDVVLAEAGVDLRAWPTRYGRHEDRDGERVWVNGWEIAYGVANAAEHGWYSDDSRAPKGGLTDDEKEARRTARENGKLFESATTVRRDWVKKFLERRTLPADWPTIPALVIADLSTGFHYGTRDDAADAIGIDRPGWTANGYRNTFLELITSNTAQAPHVLLALAIAELEKRWDKQGWQNHTPNHLAYLRQLNAWGYPLADIEQQMLTTAAATESETAA